MSIQEEYICGEERIDIHYHKNVLDCAHLHFQSAQDFESVGPVEVIVEHKTYDDTSQQLHDTTENTLAILRSLHNQRLTKSKLPD